MFCKLMHLKTVSSLSKLSNAIKIIERNNRFDFSQKHQFGVKEISNKVEPGLYFSVIYKFIPQNGVVMV